MSQILYKYRCWDDENHRRILEEGEIFFVSPKEFNDPFDCRIPFNIYDTPIDVMEQKIGRVFEKRNFQASKRDLPLTRNSINSRKSAKVRKLARDTDWTI